MIGEDDGCRGTLGDRRYLLIADQLLIVDHLLAVGSSTAVDIERIDRRPAAEDVLARRLEIRAALGLSGCLRGRLVAAKEVSGLVVPTRRFVSVTHAAPD